MTGDRERERELESVSKYSDGEWKYSDVPWKYSDGELGLSSLIKSKSYSLSGVMLHQGGMGNSVVGGGGVGSVGGGGGGPSGTWMLA